MRRGFTIVEIIVVVSVISILASIGIVGYNQYQLRSTDGQARSIAAAVRSSAERYYARNNEYPDRATLGSTSDACTVPSNYNTASTVLNVPTATLSASKTKFALLAASGGLCSSTDTSLVYYVAKNSADTASRNVGVNVTSSLYCTYAFPESGSRTFMIVYWSNADSKWLVSKSANGTLTPNQTTAGCAFTAL